MVYFDRSIAREKTLEYLRYPVPRTPVSITRKLQEELDNFYPNTPAYRATEKLKKHILKDLERKNLIVKYTKEDRSWETGRELIRRYCEATGNKKPRKLSELYQINFFYLEKDANIYKLPVLKDINLEMTTLMYRFIRDKSKENFFWNLLNLFYCYSKDEYKGKIRVKIHGRLFSEEESKSLNRLLKHTDKVNKVLQDFPFQPDLDRSIEFLESL